MANIPQEFMDFLRAVDKEKVIRSEEYLQAVGAVLLVRCLSMRVSCTLFVFWCQENEVASKLDLMGAMASDMDLTKLQGGKIGFVRRAIDLANGKLAQDVHGIPSSATPSSDGNSIRALIQVDILLHVGFCFEKLCGSLLLGDKGRRGQSSCRHRSQDQGAFVSFDYVGTCISFC